MSGRRKLEAWWKCCVARESENIVERNIVERRPSTVCFTPSSGLRAVTPKQTLFMEHNGKKLEECYSLERVLGKGGFGIVRKAHLKGCSGIIRAIKEVRKRDMRVNLAVRREAAILQRLDHPSVCRIFETFEDKSNIYLVMEYVEGRELFEEMIENLDGKRFDEARYAAIMGEVFNALQYLHKHEVLHRDLKPENIMVCHRAASSRSQACRQPHIKLIDFGLAVLTRPNGSFHACRTEGTSAYLAPEAVDHLQFSPASDLWSTGVTIFVMYLGHFPTLAGMHYKMRTVRSPQARNLLEGLLQEDPRRRISAADAARHPWVCNGRALSDRQQPGDLQKVSESFVEFYQSDKLKRAAFTAVALQDTSQQMDALREQFDLIDLDGNGVITKDELTKAFQAAPPAHVKDIRIWAEALFDELDSNGSGEIEFSQWQAAALRSSTEISDAVMQAAFRTIDVDNTGSISSDNLSRLLQVDGAELNSIMNSADLNGDGVIDFEEFKAIFARLAPQVSSNDTHLSPGARTVESPVPTEKSGPSSGAPGFFSDALPWTDSADGRQMGPRSDIYWPSLGLAPLLLDY